ncbi:MAG TPA: ParB/RepB/Spo0J family partition protein [Smithellaceae bacterium]|nr:MAG: Chromosome-partitioning protein Spo0J [Firmicutes bacterium ADurb.Bin193]HNS55593.1 ParB/RepB/Spo0J family partition protein [Smithellaceae bacterium]
MATKQDKLLEMSIAEFKKKNKLDTVAPLLDARVEFSYIPLKKIVIDEQVRSKDDVEEELESLTASIKEKGVVVPVLVVSEGNDKYRLVAGERRYRASVAANTHNIPARILPDGISRQDIMTIQLLENLQRKDLNPVDEARAYYDYYAIRTGKKGVEPQEIVSHMITFSSKPDNLENELTDILSEIVKIAGKSIKYIERLVTILKLPNEALETLRNKQINMSQALIFVEHINHPRFNDVLAKAVRNKLTAKGVEKAFAGKKRGGGIAFYKKRIVQVRGDVEKNLSNISKQYAKDLLSEIKEFEKILHGIIKES